MSAIQHTQSMLPSPARIFTPAVTGILLSSIVGYLLFVFFPDWATSSLALGVQNVLKGKIWQLVTYPLINNSPASLVFSALIILSVGSAIEREWRTASFLLLWLVISVSCGVIWVIINLLTGNNLVGMGAAACSYGFIATLGLLFRGRRFFIFFATIEAQYLALFLVAIGIIMSITTPMNLVWVLGAPVAYVYTKLRWSIASKSARNIASEGYRRQGHFVDID